MLAAEPDSTVTRRTCSRIPTPRGEFQLCLYSDSPDGKEHLALIIGDIAGKRDVLVRVHSECFTGDVLGSLRCDCGEQLDLAMETIQRRGAGVIVYLRQEGRGIGLLDKLRAYNLQDQGYDTVDANLMLGHEADERDYTVAAQILEDLGIQSIEIMTNNPIKVTALQELGVQVTRRIPIQVAVSPENAGYLQTKARRMDHLLDFASEAKGVENPHSANGVTKEDLIAEAPSTAPLSSRPAVTLSYAQSLDGSIAAQPGAPLRLSGDQAMKMTHRLRASHDAILVGIGTVLADDPRLTVRLVQGRNPQPVIIDSRLRLPLNANLFTQGRHKPWIVTSERADMKRQRDLEATGATVMRVPTNVSGQIDLGAMLDKLGSLGISSLMVEGGSRIISSFLSCQLVDQIVVTIAPQLVGGLHALNGHGEGGAIHYPRLANVHYQWLGEDMVLWGQPVWEQA